MFDKPPKSIFFPDVFNVEMKSFIINGSQVDSIDIRPKNQKDKAPVLEMTHFLL